MGSPKGDVLADLRREAEATDGTLEAAEVALEVGAGYLSHVLAGRYRPGRDVAARMQVRYGISVSRWTAPKKKKRKRSGGRTERHQAA